MGPGGSAIILMALVISGYIFNLIFHPFRYYAKRAEGQRLFFMSAGTGLLLGALVFGVCGWVKGSLQPESRLLAIAQALASAVPVPHANKLMLTFLFAAGLAWLLNIFSVRIVGGARTSHPASTSGKRRSRAQCVFDKLTERHGSPMAKLLRRAVDQQKLVMVTLKSRKLYCGRIFEVAADIDAADACFEILPTFSTYRDKDTLKMGDDRTRYPAIDVWAAMQRLRTVQRELAMFPRLLEQAVPASRRPEMQEPIRLHRLKCEAEMASLRTLIDAAPGGTAFDILDWVKVIPLKDVESASFYDADAYAAWFAERPAGDGNAQGETSGQAGSSEPEVGREAAERDAPRATDVA